MSGFVAIAWFRFRLPLYACVLAALLAGRSGAQTVPPTGSVTGTVRNQAGRVVPGANVYLKGDHAPALSTRTDAKGGYSFRAVPTGTYNLSAELAGQGRGEYGPFSVKAKDKKTIDLVLGSANTATKAPEFFDEPQFTVAGVTQTTGAGGHGSDTVLRTSDALARATVSLGNPGSAASPDPAQRAALEQARKDVRERLATQETAALHHELADLDEKLADPLEAVQHYQRAAELDPSEPYLFDWGAELLAHRAVQPAAAVFSRGHRLFPRSTRMLIGLGVSWYDRGSYEQAARCLFDASDLDPKDPAPYLFLGRMRDLEIKDPQEMVDRLARFAALEPDNPEANYYYAVSLWKQLSRRGSGVDASQVQGLLRKAIQLDSKFADAYVELGAIYYARQDFPRAIEAYEHAIEAAPDSPEAHYRLVQAFRRTGATAKAEEQLQIFQQLSKKDNERAERQRHEIQQFVVTLRNSPQKAQPSPK